MIFLDQKPVFEQTEDEKYDKALELILDNLSDNDSEVRAISVNAPRGVGKTHLLNDVYSKINKANLKDTVVFYAQCSALTQVSPYGLIQSFFSTLFECPSVLKDEFNMKGFEYKVLDKLNLEKIDESRYQSYLEFVEEAKVYKNKIKNEGNKTEDKRKLQGSRVAPKISIKKRSVSRNTSKQNIYKEIDNAGND